MAEINIITLLANEYHCKIPNNVPELLDFVEVVFNNVALLKDIDVDSYVFEAEVDGEKTTVFSKED
jgi:hypothetical protein